jgi:hypothetical protein
MTAEERAHRRFRMNMERIARLMKLAASGEGQFKPVGFWTYDGVTADVYRMIVVFLHSATEDFVRSFLPKKSKFQFSSANDIFGALKRAGYDPAHLEEIKKPLDELAKRRIRIVHYGDMKENAVEIEQWSITDIWLIMQWNISVIVFVHLFLPIVSTTDFDSRRKYRAARNALDRNAEFGHSLIDFPKDLKDAVGAKDNSKVQSILSALSDKLTAINVALDDLKSPT